MKALGSKISNNLHRLMFLPATILFVVFFIVPLCQGIGVSLTDWNGFSEERNFIGLDNFIRFFSDKRAMNAIGVTLLFGLVSPLLLNVFGLLLALLFDSKIKGKVFARTAVYMPSIISPLIMGYLWTLILSPSTGVLDKSLEQLGVNGSFDWMGDPKKAIWLIIIVNVWQFVGGPMMIYLAGLQSVPMDLYESAKIDGANTWQSFKNVTWPLLLCRERRRKGHDGGAAEGAAGKAGPHGGNREPKRFSRRGRPHRLGKRKQAHPDSLWKLLRNPYLQPARRGNDMPGRAALTGKGV